MKRMVFISWTCVCLLTESSAQWSRSTVAESTLYVCPGFYPAIVTYADGSSMIFGALDSYIYAQRLDEFGCRQWAEPVMVFHNDSSFIGSAEGLVGDSRWGGWIDDGEGGAIIWWNDHRDALLVGDPIVQYKTSAIYVQRIDRDGKVLWDTQGLKVTGVETGLKQTGDIGAAMVKDGQGGVILAWSEDSYNYPGALNKSYLRAQRISSSGDFLWAAGGSVLDSSDTEFSLSHISAKHAGTRTYILARTGAYIIDLQGERLNGNPLSGYKLISSDRDIALFVLNDSDSLSILKFDSLGEVDWQTPLVLPAGCQGARLFANPLIGDGQGGAYYMYECNDTILHLNEFGVIERPYFRGSGNGGWVHTDGSNGLLIVQTSTLTVTRYSTNGEWVWSSPVTILNDPDNAFFELSAGDNRGGLIVSFWTTSGGIYAQHSGRFGGVGIVTVAESENVGLADQFQLYQNFPNPFNSVTKIRYEFDQTQQVRLEIFSLLGERLLTIVESIQHPGVHEAVVDVQDFSSGIYFYRLQVGNRNQAKSMVLIR